MTEHKKLPVKAEFLLYKTEDGKIKVETRLENETVWLNLNQIATLFGRDKSVISRHLRNVYRTKELEAPATVAKFATVQSEGKRTIRREIEYYNLDAIISVGYRVNSKKGTQFRIWATNVLKQHLISGYTINEKLLRENRAKLQRLGELIKHIRAEKSLAYDEAMGLLDIVGDYSYALGLLDDFDRKKLKLSGLSGGGKFKLTYSMARKGVDELKAKTPAPGYFGQEKDASFKSSIAAVYQTFGGKELYPSIEEKAAHLLYFIIKNHSFVDGNKRIAASIFLWFLEKNGILYKTDGSKRVADNALVALTLMIAESNPADKDVMTTLVVNLINKNN